MAIPGIDTSASAAGSARTRLSDNYDTFLVLLTAQLQNQDPLAPMDSTQFTQQLVQFSQVEQQIRTNEQLEGLVSHYQAASAGSALSYLGRDAILESPYNRLGEGSVNWGYSFDKTADEVTLTVKNSSGRIVFERTGEMTEGDHLFTWDGKNADGEDMPDGVYTLSVTAKDADGETMDARITVRETIMGVDFSGTNPLIVTQSGSHDLGKVRAILDAT